jgi:hypothetical protein
MIDTRKTGRHLIAECRGLNRYMRRTDASLDLTRRELGHVPIWEPLGRTPNLPKGIQILGEAHPSNRAQAAHRRL